MHRRSTIQTTDVRACLGIRHSGTQHVFIYVRV